MNELWTEVNKDQGRQYRENTTLNQINIKAPFRVLILEKAR